MAKEMRLIDANDLKKSMFSYYGCVNEHTSKRTYNGETLMDYEVADLIEDCIDNAPTVDAVPVVRCKDCIYWESGKSYVPYCNRFENGLQDCKADDFCSYGERRSEQAWISRRK